VQKVEIDPNFTPIFLLYAKKRPQVKTEDEDPRLRLKSPALINKHGVFHKPKQILGNGI
jgi:hypothetical protein